MATPKIYKILQPKFAKYFWVFSILAVVFFIIGCLLMLNSPTSAEKIPIEFLGFIACGLLSCMSMILSMVASYQKPSKLRGLPVIGSIHKALMPEPTEWGEALHINFTILLQVLFLTIFLIILASF